MTHANNNTARLRWRCRRGTREMDLLLLCFLERDYPHLDDREQSLFGSLLDEADPDLYAWITAQAEPANPDYLPIIGKINNCSHSDSSSVIVDRDCPLSSDSSSVIVDRDCPLSSGRDVMKNNDH